MLKEYKFQTSLCVWGGVFFGLFGFALAAPGTSYETFGQLLMAGGYLLMACGCFLYARGKGYGWMMGLVGILGPVGVTFIYLLRDRSASLMKKRKKEEEM
jgi:hypothetical protein